MPLYDFICPTCEKTQESSVSMRDLDTHVEACSDCSTPMKRLVSAPTFTFAGEPPKDFKPLSKSKPKSYNKSIHDIKRVQN